MKRASPSTSVLVLAVPVLLACGAESPDLPSAPTMRAAPSAQLEDGDATSFSEWTAPVNLGPVINSSVTEIEVAISKDERSLYFSSNRPGGFGGFDIWVSQRQTVNDPWGPPQNLGPTVNTSSNEQAPFVTPDGRRLYLFSNRPGGFGGNDLYVAQRQHKHDDFAWGTPENLGSGVNSAANENSAAELEDGETGITTLYFNSSRLGGVGLTDVYASILQADGTFGPGELVAEVSSPARDAGLAIRRDGLEIVLASDRPGSLGLFDLWVSTRASTSDAWSTPVNPGTVVNTAADESRFGLSADGTALYIISDRAGGSGNLDIWLSTRNKVDE